MGFLVKIFGAFFTLKILPNIIASLVVFLIYAIVIKITNDESVGLVSAFAGGFLPMYNNITINTLNPHFFLAPLFLLSLNYMIKSIKSPKHSKGLIFVTSMLILFHPFSLVFVATLWLYLILVKLEGKKFKKHIFELGIFASLLWYVVYYFIFGAGAFHLGMKIFSMGVPNQIFAHYYTTFTLLRAFSGIGIIVVLLGVMGAYQSLKKEKKKTINLRLFIFFYHF